MSKKTPQTPSLVIEGVRTFGSVKVHARSVFLCYIHAAITIMNAFGAGKHFVLGTTSFELKIMQGQDGPFVVLDFKQSKGSDGKWSTVAWFNAETQRELLAELKRTNRKIEVLVDQVLADLKTGVVRLAA